MPTIPMNKLIDALMYLEIIADEEEMDQVQSIRIIDGQIVVARRVLYELDLTPQPDDTQEEVTQIEEPVYAQYGDEAPVSLDDVAQVQRRSAL